MTPQDKLRHAAMLIEEASGALNVKHTHCKCCDRPIYANWTAKQASDALVPMVDKLRRIAGGSAFDKKLERVA